MPNYVATTSVEGGIVLSKYLLCHQNRLPILAVEVLSEREKWSARLLLLPYK